jgi:5-methylcytosine-specific restriction protein B
MLPKYDLNTNLISEEYSKILKTLNKRIEILLDKDNLIGHSFFMKENGEDKDLEFIFRYEIVPLLEEYFYKDYEKIQLVLGNKNLKKSPSKELEDFEKDIYKYWFENKNEFDGNLGEEKEKKKEDIKLKNEEK